MMTPEQLAEIEQQTKTMRGPWFVADCEGELQIWRESALRSIDRDDTGEVTSYQLPGHYRVIDLIAGWDLDTWDPGDDEDDDQRRQVAEWIGSAPQAILALVAEVRRLTAERDELRQQVLTGPKERT